ncbi:unnamed protein product [Pleuronectes platessa]|uniref:Uncharacterized protein n=1 Tax=Pleuronectes platessa TaxID=8262 RepID=A0A9N7VZ36_PLEPL|nr:unnamed protein product [Pleuronectes platessa]
MSTLHSLNVFISQRLSAAVEEIIGRLETVISEYEEDMKCRQLRLTAQRQTVGVQQHLVIKEEVLSEQQEWISSLDKQAPKSPHFTHRRFMKMTNLPPAQQTTFNSWKKMSTLQSLKTFINQRLAVAVDDIFGLLETTISNYEEEIDRQRRLLEDERSEFLTNRSVPLESHFDTTDASSVDEMLPTDSKDNLIPRPPATERHNLWPAVFPIPTFSYNTEMALRQAGQTDDSLENVRIALIAVSMTEDNRLMINDMMSRTYSCRRREVVSQSIHVAEFKERWPALFDPFQGGAAAIPGGDAASQDALYGAPVEVAENPGVHVELPDGVFVMGPGQVISDVDPEELEAADSLHLGPVDGEGGVFFSSSLPVVHDQLLRFADVEMEVVVLAPRCQGSDLLSVGLLIVDGDQAYDSGVISKLNDGVGAVGGHAVLREQGVQKRSEHAALGGTGVESQGGGFGAADPHRLWSARQKVQYLLTEGNVEPKVGEGSVEGEGDGICSLPI